MSGHGEISVDLLSDKHVGKPNQFRYRLAGKNSLWPVLLILMKRIIEKRIMKLSLLPIVLLLAGACQERGEDSSKKLSGKQHTMLPDTIIGSKAITNEIAGSAYRKRAKGYFLIAHQDTSDFTCIVTESKEGGRIGMDVRFQPTMTYQKQWQELARILPEAAKDFALDSLSTVFISRLVTTRDLAAKITDQYTKQYGANKKIKSYQDFSAFLLTSQLTADFNRLFEPYSVTVKAIYPEKVFFTTKKELYWASKIETDSTLVPNRILDCLTWIGLNYYPQPPATR